MGRKKKIDKIDELYNETYNRYLNIVDNVEYLQQWLENGKKPLDVLTSGYSSPLEMLRAQELALHNIGRNLFLLHELIGE